MRNLNMNQPRLLTDFTRAKSTFNLNGPVQIVQEFLPHLKSRPNALIVNVSSGLAYIPLPLSPIYSASKAGLHAFTRCLHVQLKGSGGVLRQASCKQPAVLSEYFPAESLAFLQ